MDQNANFQWLSSHCTHKTVATVWREEERNSLRSVSKTNKFGWQKKLKHANFWIGVSLRQPADYWCLGELLLLLMTLSFSSQCVCLCECVPARPLCPLFLLPLHSLQCLSPFLLASLPHLSITAVHSIPVRCLISEPTRMWSPSTSFEHKNHTFCARSHLDLLLDGLAVTRGEGTKDARENESNKSLNPKLECVI